MIDGQTSIFEMLYPTYKITKPIRLIEFFAGYGSQSLALKYLGVPFEHWKICEWAVKSIQAYKDIHFTDDDKDYSLGLLLEDLQDILFRYGISSNYNEPMTKQQISRLNEKQLRTIFNNICSTHNLVNIQQVKGDDLCIKDTDKFTYLLTYSFPCQDLSNAGHKKGMSDTSTRSGMLWEVERILSELDDKPQVLLMENVPQVHGLENVEDFNKWQLRLEELGYKNYWQDLIATDYGIPQTRNRTFMVSILGDYNYTFPRPQPLELKLKDMLEDNVPDKYYLSDSMMNYIVSKDDKYKVNENNLVINRDIACTKTTREGRTRADATDYICNDLPNNFNIKQANIIGHLEQWHQRGFVYDENSSMTTICATDYKTPKLVGINNLKIRKLTPKECFRLMGVKDEDYENVKKHQSDSSLYHLAGDSIVVNVLMAIFKEMI